MDLSPTCLHSISTVFCFSLYCSYAWPNEIVKSAIFTLWNVMKVWSIYNKGKIEGPFLQHLYSIPWRLCHVFSLKCLRRTWRATNHMLSFRPQHNFCWRSEAGSQLSNWFLRQQLKEANTFVQTSVHYIFLGIWWQCKYFYYWLCLKLKHFMQISKNKSKR